METREHCDQIGRFFALWATIILPKLPTLLGNFCKCVKIIHFSCEIVFWATFIDIWRFSSGHTECDLKSYEKFITN